MAAIATDTLLAGMTFGTASAFDPLTQREKLQKNHNCAIVLGCMLACVFVLLATVVLLVLLQEWMSVILVQADQQLQAEGIDLGPDSRL